MKASPAAIITRGCFEVSGESARLQLDSGGWLVATGTHSPGRDITDSCAAAAARAGLTGPATYAAALAVAREETGTLPEAPDDEQVSKICWSLVEASIEVDETVPGDNRKVTDARVLLTRICDSKEAREEP